MIVLLFSSSKIILKTNILNIKRIYLIKTNCVKSHVASGQSDHSNKIGCPNLIIFDGLRFDFLILISTIISLGQYCKCEQS